MPRQEMFVPFISAPRSKILERRAGGGGGGSSGGGAKGGGSSSGPSSGPKSGGSGSSSSSGGGRGSGSPKSVPLSGSNRPAGQSSSTAYGRGGGPISNIPSGSPFAGRTQGGGTRDQVFGSRTYGSGYPGMSGRGVAGRGFPFYFWPVVWGGAIEAGSVAYLSDGEYGEPNNSSRLGGEMVQATFQSNSSNTTFHVLSDNTTVTSLIYSIDSNCSSSLSSSSSTSPQPFNPNAMGSPSPGQAIQYYRASSVVLTLDGYNDTAPFSNDTSTPDTPLPDSIDTKLLDCLNQTIAVSAPLFDSESTSVSPSGPSGVTTPHGPFFNGQQEGARPEMNIIALVCAILAFSSLIS